MLNNSQMELVDALAEALLKQRAQIRRSIDQRPFSFQKITLSLDTAATEGNPYPLSIPFTSIAVESVTDAYTYVTLSPHNDDIQALANGKKLGINDSLDFGETIAKAYLTWPAQAGKSITLIFMLESSFKSGSLLSVNAGGVSINSGSSFTQSLVVVGAASATQLFAANTSRKQGTVTNDSGADLWVGPAGVNNGAAKGLLIPPGSTFSWQNTAKLYAYSVAGCTLSILEEI